MSFRFPRQFGRYFFGWYIYVELGRKPKTYDDDDLLRRELFERGES